MKKFATLSVCIFTLLFLATSKTSAQIDTARMNEIRLSAFGVDPYLINIEGYTEEPLNYFRDVSFAYLRKMKNHNRLYYKLDLSVGRRQISEFEVFTEKQIADGQLRYSTVYLGIERQTQFRHFGLFVSAGVRAGMANFKSDFTPIELDPVIDFQKTYRSIGVAGQATAFTNISDNIYVFVTVTMQIGHHEVKYSDILNPSCCENYSGLDTNIYYPDAIGVAYKF